MNDSEDNNLVEKAKRGDEDSLIRIFDKYNYIFKNLGYHAGFDYFTIEDLSQKARIKIWKNLEKFKTNTNLAGWITQIFKNIIIDHVRYLKEHNPIDSSYVTLNDYEWLNLAEEESPPQSENVFFQKKFEKAFNNLSETHKDTINYHLLQGKSFTETSKIMNCKRGTVMSRYSYAKKYLKRQLEPFKESFA